MATPSHMRSLTIGKPEKGVDYEERTAVRCIISQNDQVCVIHVKKGNYYKLPGGGVEPEDPDEYIAAKREALEECGCEVDVKSTLLAQTLEWRGTLKQTSKAYLCTVVKDTGSATLTELEAEEGLSHEWCSLDDALEKMTTITPTNELGRFIQQRDTFLLACSRELRCESLSFP